MDIGAGGASEAGPVAAGSEACLVAVLGPVWVHPGLGAADLGSPKQRDLLAVLAVHADAVVDHAVLAEALWDGHPPRTYVHSLQLYVSGLRRALTTAGSAVDIETHRRGYRLAVPRREVDLFRFGLLVQKGTAEAAREQWNVAAEHLGQALTLWRGPVLPEFAGREFAVEAVTAAASARLEALEALAAAQLALGDAETAARTAGEVVATDGLRERARGVLMLALFRTGRTAQALRAFEEQRRVLDEELGALPSAELRRLHERILRHDQSLLGPEDGRTGSDGSTTAESTDVPKASTKWMASPQQAERPAGPTSSGRGHRWALLLAGLLVAVGAGTATTNVLAGNRTPVADTALLVHYGDGEVGILIESGFDRGVADFDLKGREVIAEDLNAALTIDEQVTPGALVVNFSLETDITEVARRHREARFVTLDNQNLVVEPNVATIRFSTHEAAYLAGFAAARTTATGTVGFIGGVDFETIWPFEAGFVAGARAADPGVEVLVRYLAEPPDYADGFLNPQAGERTARRLYGEGADVVFAAAGTSGLGAFEAATSKSTPQRHLWAIGVDADQYETIATLPGTVDVEGWRRHILTSVVLRFDRAVYGALAAYARGEFQPGLRRYDLANGGVELSYSGGYLDAHRAELEQVGQAVRSGQVEVPCRPERVPIPAADSC